MFSHRANSTQKKRKKGRKGKERKKRTGDEQKKSIEIGTYYLYSSSYS